MKTAQDFRTRARARNLTRDIAETGRLFDEATAALSRLSIQCLMMKEFEAKAASTWDMVSGRAAAMSTELRDLQRVQCPRARG